MIIIILGPDGSGKTTLAKKLSSEIAELNYIYFGSNPDQRIYKYFSNFIKRNRTGFFYTLLKYIVIYINDFSTLNKSKGSHYIADRSPIDNLIFSKLKNSKLRYWYHYLAHKTLPKPQLVIQLTGDSSVLYNRKKEISIESINKLNKAYGDFIKNCKQDTLTIDTTKNSLDTVIKIAKEKILTYV